MASQCCWSLVMKSTFDRFTTFYLFLPEPTSILRIRRTSACFLQDLGIRGTPYLLIVFRGLGSEAGATAVCVAMAHPSPVSILSLPPDDTRIRLDDFAQKSRNLQESCQSPVTLRQANPMNSIKVLPLFFPSRYDKHVV